MFENEEIYRRKPETVHAVRLTAEGNVPITHADAGWVKAAVADKRLKYAPDGYWFANTGVNLQAAYPGDWLVLDDGTGKVSVWGDERFRAGYEAIPFAEGE